MADMYDRFRAMTIRNLKPRSQGGKGLECELQVTTDNVYNEETDTYESTTTLHEISGIRASYKIRHVDGDLIRVGDVKFYMCPVLVDGTDSPTPETTNKILFDETLYMIVTVKKWRHAGTDCGWLLQLREG